jgi:acyl carrier protein
VGKPAEAHIADMAGPPLRRDGTTSVAHRAAPPGAGTASGVAAVYAEVLAGVLKTAQVPPSANFFDDLGADSMVMAQFCARVRKVPDVPNVSIKDVYQHPTISALAAALAPPDPVPVRPPPRSNDTQPIPILFPTVYPVAPSRRPRPALRAPRSAASVVPDAGAGPVEHRYAQILAGVLQTDRVPTDGHFFEDLDPGQQKIEPLWRDGHVIGDMAWLMAVTKVAMTKGGKTIEVGINLSVTFEKAAGKWLIRAMHFSNLTGGAPPEKK